jgi:hypothetical protein
MMLLRLQWLKSLFSGAWGGFEWANRPRTIYIKDWGDFDGIRMKIFAIIEGRSRKSTLKTKYNQGSERGRFQNNSIPMRD